MALEYIDLTYDLASQLPRSKEYNLKSQIIRRRNWVSNVGLLDRAYASAQTLAAKLHSMRKAILADSRQLREESTLYVTQDSEPDMSEI